MGRIQDFVAFNIMWHSGLCRSVLYCSGYVAFGVMSFGIMSHSALCGIQTCVVRDFVIHRNVIWRNFVGRIVVQLLRVGRVPVLLKQIKNHLWKYCTVNPVS